MNCEFFDIRYPCAGSGDPNKECPTPTMCTFNFGRWFMKRCGKTLRIKNPEIGPVGVAMMANSEEGRYEILICDMPRTFKETITGKDLRELAFNFEKHIKELLANE